MMNRIFWTHLTVFCCVCLSFAAAATSFDPVPQFPEPAAGSYTVVGTGLPDGRFLLWNGDAIYLQSSVGSGLFNQVASGYVGDPAFAAVSPDAQTVVLGGGFTPKLYRLDVNAWTDHTPASEIAVISHFAGIFLDNSLVALDRGKDDFSGAEIVVVDISGSKAAGSARVVLSTPATKAQVVDKPPFAYSAQIAVDAALTTVYVMDGNTRELRSFAVADLINAYNTATPLSWNIDGMLIGAAGTYFNGGPSGVTSSGHLVIGGAEGFGEPGGIQLVDPLTGTVVETLDPTGTQQYVSVVFNPVTDGMIAIDGFTFNAYASAGSVGSLPATGWTALILLLLTFALLVTRSRRA